MLQRRQRTAHQLGGELAVAGPSLTRSVIGRSAGRPRQANNGTTTANPASRNHDGPVASRAKAINAYHGRGRQHPPPPRATDADGAHRASATPQRRHGRRQPAEGASCPPPRLPTATPARSRVPTPTGAHAQSFTAYFGNRTVVIRHHVAGVSAQVPHRRAQTTPRPRPLGQDRPPLLLPDHHLSRDVLGHIHRPADPARTVINRLGILDAVPDIDTSSSGSTGAET